MKRILLPVAVLLSLVAGSVALAANTSRVVISPATKMVTAGQTFTMTVTVSPVGNKLYTAKVAVQYPANLLEAKSFAFANGWLPLSQSGYDNIDNVNGLLIKTAGYQGGLTADKTLGTITFKAKAAGVATVTLGGGTMLLDAANANVFGSGVAATVTVKVAPSATPTPTPSGSPVAVATEEPSDNDDQLAAVAESSGGFATKKVGGIAAAAVLVALISYLWKRRK